MVQTVGIVLLIVMEEIFAIYGSLNYQTAILLAALINKSKQ